MSGISGLGGFGVSASGLRAERMRMEVAASNIANAETTRGPEGTPYRRRLVVFSEQLDQTMGAGGAGGAGRDLPGGVEIASIEQDPSPFRTVHDPGHPDANADGVVELPNVDIAMEMVDLASAARAYEANLTALRSLKTAAESALTIGGNA